MSASTWLLIAIIGFSLAGIALVVAIFMFFKMNIPAVIGDLSGKTVAKQIKAMRSNNADSGKLNRGTTEEQKANAAAKAAAHASKRLDKTGERSEKLHKQEGVEKKRQSTTESFSHKINEVDIEQRRGTAVLTETEGTAVLTEERGTEVLTEERGTEVLTEERATEILVEDEVLADEWQTAVLSEPEGTCVLSDAEPEMPVVTAVGFRVTRSVIEIHTDEVI